MQKNSLSIIDIVDAVKKTKTKYLQLLKKLDKEENFIFTAFLIFKKIVKETEENGNESGEPVYQSEKIKCYTQEKKYLVDNAAHIIKSIVERIEEQYSNVYNTVYMRIVEKSKYILSDEGDSLLFDICHILNSFFWPNLNFGVVDSLLKSQIFKSLHRLHARYSSLFKYDKNNLENSYINIVKYVKQYFNIIEVGPLDIWTKLRKRNLILQYFC